MPDPFSAAGGVNTHRNKQFTAGPVKLDYRIYAWKGAGLPLQNHVERPQKQLKLLLLLLYMLPSFGLQRVLFFMLTPCGRY